MLPRAFRLTRPQFLSAKSHARTLHHSHFTVLYTPNQIDHNRYSIITSSKLSPRSVVRSRLRRAIYQSLRNSPGTFDLIIIPRRSVINLSHEEIGLELNSLLSKISLL